ncbi:DNA-directed RNA polymerase mitochondrial [Spathaspora sp. JA1]|nr:DNA-directed RNA polymerase mitochondrial [Spathaspora sp. JA1]
MLGTSITELHETTHHIESHHPTRIQAMNQYIRAIKTEDILGLFSAVHRLGRLESSNRDQDLESYVYCLQFALNLFMKSENLNHLKLLKPEIDRYLRLTDMESSEVFNELTKEKVGIAVAKAIIHMYHVANRSRATKRLSPLIVDFLLNNLADFNLDIRTVASEVSEDYLRFSLIDICQKRRIPIPIFKQQQEENTNRFEHALAKYKNEYGFMPIEDLYTFVKSTQFNWSGRIPDSVKLYEYYDTLTIQEQREFMQAFVEFQTEKQEMVEEAMDFIEYIPTEFKKKLAESIELINNVNSNTELINQWITQASDKLNAMLQAQPPTNDQEKLLQRYQGYFTFIRIESHIQHILSEILSKEAVALYEIKFHLRYFFDKVMIKATQFKHKGGIMKYMNRTDRDQIIGIFIQVLLDTATIDISDDNVKLITTMEENKGAKINEKFLEPNTHGSYPAFITTIKTSGEKVIPVIKMHPLLEPDSRGETGNVVNRLPMLVPPRPWVSLFEGGYLKSQDCVFMARLDKTYLNYFRQASSAGHLDSVFMTLNKLGSLAWAINPDMLDILNTVSKIPSGFIKIAQPITRKPKARLDDQLFKTSYGTRIAFNRLLDIANGYAENGEMLYTPYQVDFRGRVYPTANISHILADEFRSLFMFWHSKPLGPQGFNWVKYHLSSMFGNSGFHIGQAVEFVDSHKEDIIDSVRDPLNGKQWWLKSKSPFQTLAACMEVCKIWEFKGNIQDYRTRFPVHQDGSCNGLQHYAALTRDEIGGKAVNLLPGEQKQDIYMEVAKIVESKLQALSQESSDQAELARLGLIVVSRKLVKQTVMTTVYGVTLIGATDQVGDRINDFVKDCQTNPHMTGVVDQETLKLIETHKLKLNTLLANLILGSISKLFAPATAVQQWLRNNVKRVLHSYRPDTIMYLQAKKPKLFQRVFQQPKSFRPIIWRTPSGFPVIQYYVKSTNQEYKTILSSVVGSQGKKALSPMDIKKNINGIAPNYIHSLDAVHMMNTCNSMTNAGLGFAAVHDSFWTHPCDVDQMGVILRQEFVNLHQPDLLERLKQDLEKQVRDSFQLCCFKSKHYPELSAAIRSIRKTYGKNLSEVLFHEMTDESSRSEISELVQQSKPKLYFAHEEYISSSIEPEKYVRDKSQKVWVFVPTQIQDLPQKGNLDLNQVLQSEFFFH